MRKLKGWIKWPTLKKMMTGRDYKGHTIDKGVYKIEIGKSKFEVVPKNVKYYNVYKIYE